MISRLSIAKRVIFCITFLYVIFVSFYNLSFLTLRIYDEARNGVNAFEMYQSGNYLFTTFEYKPDLWNTKPPLLAWLQVISMHIVGPSDLAVRIPVVLCGLAIAFLIYRFSYRTLKSFWVGIVAVLYAFSSPVFTGLHGLQTGDFDVPLTFFLLGFALMFYNYLHFAERRYLFYSFCFFSLAFLTKGVASVTYIPGIVVFLFLNRRLIKTIKEPYFWVAATIPILVIFGYYGLRELNNSGYLEAMIKNELLGRYVEVNEGHTTSATFYLGIMLVGWRNVLLIGLAFSSVLFILRDSPYKKSILYFFCIAIVFLIVISVSATRLKWYLLPAYPLFGLLLGIAFQNIFDYFGLDQVKGRNIYKAGIIAVLFGYNMYNTVLSRLFPSDSYKPEIYEAAQMLKEHNVEPRSTFVDLGEYSPQILFYAYVSDIKYKNYNSVGVNTNTAVIDTLIKSNIEENLGIKPIRNVKNVSYYKLEDGGVVNELSSYPEEVALIKDYYFLYGSKTLENSGAIIYRGNAKPERLSYEFNSNGLKFEIEEWDLLPNKNRVRYIQLKEHPTKITTRKLETKDVWLKMFSIP